MTDLLPEQGEKMGLQTSTADLPVQHFTLVTLWPLAVRRPKDADNHSQCQFGRFYDDIRDSIEFAKDTWKPVKNRLHHLRRLQEIDDTSKIERDEYAEFVYFYPFVQKFLFGNGAGPEDADDLTIYRHRHVKGVEIEDKRLAPQPLRLNVPRMALYVFRTGDVVLATEFEAQESITLSQAMMLNERLRRCYPPYFISDEKSGRNHPQLVLDRVTWLAEPAKQEGAPFPESDWLKTLTPAFSDEDSPAVNTWETLTDDVNRGTAGPCRNPLLLRWKQVLPRLTHGLTWRQVQDDRMPAVSSLTLDDPSQLTRGDWVRLANYDEDDGGLPYGEAFLADFETAYCYDRFWDPSNGFGTRYLSTGFGMVQVLKRADNGFHEILRTHMRRMYFQMALISHFQQAALQNLSDRLAYAINDTRRSSKTSIDRWRPVESILEDMLRFTNTYWFVDVSNQVQARELFDFFRRPLKLSTLYDQVSQEAKDANAHLNRLEDKKAANAAHAFNIIAGVGLTLSIAVGALGMNIIIPGDPDLKNLDSLDAWCIGAVTLALAAVALVGTYAVSRK